MVNSFINMVTDSGFPQNASALESSSIFVLEGSLVPGFFSHQKKSCSGVMGQEEKNKATDHHWAATLTAGACGAVTGPGLPEKQCIALVMKAIKFRPKRKFKN